MYFDNEEKLGILARPQFLASGEIKYLATKKSPSNCPEENSLH
jgi:hypothetical protein